MGAVPYNITNAETSVKNDYSRLEEIIVLLKLYVGNCKYRSHTVLLNLRPEHLCNLKTMLPAQNIFALWH